MKPLLIILLFLTGCAHNTKITPARVDTLVVIQDTHYADSSWRGHIYFTGQSISPFPLFKNGKTRDTIYEQKIVYK